MAPANGRSARGAPPAGISPNPKPAGALRVVNAEPMCAETPLARQRTMRTPNELFFLRNHFPYPTSWAGLRVRGAVARSMALDLADLERFPRKSLVATLECAGNGRAFVDPPPPGEPWGLGAVSTAEWSGVTLADVLAGAQLSPKMVEVGFVGADRFARSLPADVALHPDTLLATAMNGEPLPWEHGGPLRLVVPRWYGMASVKWVVEVAALTAPFAGRFQVRKYVIDGVPVREMRVRAIISEPAEGARVPAGEVRIAGYAWTGLGEVAAVGVSDDGGATWLEAELVAAAYPYGWTRWECTWRPLRSGPAVLVARATDSSGLAQPLEPVRNRLGYCNNAAVGHRLEVAPTAC